MILEKNKVQSTIHTKEILLPVMESFYTLQGEGFHSGRAAYFIRLAGCDVGCVWCDVKESWDATLHPKFSVETIVKNATKEIAQAVTDKTTKPIIVITGGEPLLYNLNELTKAFQDKGFETNIETSGSSPLSGYWNWICVSPKKFKAPLKEVVAQAHELKVVIFNKHDFKWAETHAAFTNKNCKLFLQPEWDKREMITPLIVDYIKTHPQWQLSIQTHKFINVP